MVCTMGRYMGLRSGEVVDGVTRECFSWGALST